MRNANKYLKLCNKVTSVINSVSRVFNGVYIDDVSIKVMDEDNEDEIYFINFQLEIGGSRTIDTWISGNQINVKVEGDWDDNQDGIYTSIMPQLSYLDKVQVEMMSSSLCRILSLSNKIKVMTNVSGSYQETENKGKNLGSTFKSDVSMSDEEYARTVLMSMELVVKNTENNVLFGLTPPEEGSNEYCFNNFLPEENECFTMTFDELAELKSKSKLGKYELYNQ